MAYAQSHVDPLIGHPDPEVQTIATTHRHPGPYTYQGECTGWEAVGYSEHFLVSCSVGCRWVHNPHERKQAHEYHVMTRDGSRCIGAFGVEEFAQAWECYQASADARISRVHENGHVYAAIIGDAIVRPLGDTKAKPVVKERVIVGWNRIEPFYRGEMRWILETLERDGMVPGFLILASEVSTPKTRSRFWRARWDEAVASARYARRSARRKRR